MTARGPARHAGPVTALVIVAALFLAARPPQLDEAERDALSARFQFEAHALAPADPPPVAARRRVVHPAFEGIVDWISSVGAGVALADLDRDGLANDVCLVDPRGDSVTVRPAPTTGARYPAFALPPPAPRAGAGPLAPMGCLPGDLNEDGHADLLVYYWGRPPAAYLKTPDVSPRPGAYRRVDIVDDQRPWFTNAAALADLDGDGHLDLLIGNYFPEDAGVLDATGARPVAMQSSMSRAANAGANVLLLGAGASGGEPVFTDASQAFPSAARVGWTLALGAGDLDGDLRPEVYFAHDFGPDRLLHNVSEPGRPAFRLVEGRRRPSDPRSKVVGRDSFKGMGVEFADLNADGHHDILVSNIAERYALQESHFAFLNTGEGGALARGRAPLTDQSERLGLSRGGWGWDVRTGDFDNDGTLEVARATGFVRGRVDRWPELHELAISNDAVVANPALWPAFGPGTDLSGDRADGFYVRDRDGVYRDVATAVGLAGTFVTRGLATADVDGDGDLDLANASQWGRSWLFRNTAASPARALVLDLRWPLAGTDATRPAIGAQATLGLPDGRVRRAQVDGGNGHSGKRAPELHFGLGAWPDDRPVAVEIAWRHRGRVHTRSLALAPGRHRIVLPVDPVPGRRSTADARP